MSIARIFLYISLFFGFVVLLQVSMFGLIGSNQVNLKYFVLPRLPFNTIDTTHIATLQLKQSFSEYCVPCDRLRIPKSQYIAHNKTDERKEGAT